ncbi:MAG: PBP1A family penicillin-binding protein [Desulfovibrionaceae bacterium]
MKILKYLLYAALAMSILGAGAMYGLYRWASSDLPNFTKITDYTPALVTTVYDRDNGVLGYFYHQKRFLVRLDEMNKWLPMAFLAAEDSAFYDHEGVDLVAIFRAFMVNMRSGRAKQGGSTITQQIVKQLLLTNVKSYERKLKEAILAYRLENYLTKEEILTIYLNEIFLGSNSYGVEAAARTYFGKHALDLTLAESAMIAGLPQAPSRYSPYSNFELAQGRQRYVLNQMHELGWITDQQHAEALAQEIVLQRMPDPSWRTGAYYLEEVRRWLINKYGEEAVYERGLSVYTACDPKHQAAAERALRRGLENADKRRGWLGPVGNVDEKPELVDRLDNQLVKPETLAVNDRILAMVTSVTKESAQIKAGPLDGVVPVESMSWCRPPNIKVRAAYASKITDARKVLKKGDVIWVSIKSLPGEGKADWAFDLEVEPEVQGALVSIAPPTGEVLALVGGYDYMSSEYNRATQAKRQPGSAFKPLVYSTAIDNGLTAASLVKDTSIVFENNDGSVWRPENYEERNYGWLSLRTALVLSKNLVTIRVAQKVGINKIIERAKALGLQAEFPHDLSLALGSASVTPMNLCSAFTVFPRQGSWVEPRLVLGVKDVWGEELYASEVAVHEVMSPQTAYIMTYLMQEVVRHGTGRKALVLGRPLAGKTGTTNDERDAWFMGFAPYLLTGVYVGFDEPRSMGAGEAGGTTALPIWIDYRKAVEEDYPVEDFLQPEGVVMSRATFEEGSKEGVHMVSYFLPFKEGTQPSPRNYDEPGAAGSSSVGVDDALLKQGF